jgi:hypothetical protein
MLQNGDAGNLPPREDVMRTACSIVCAVIAMVGASTAWSAACDGFTDVDGANATYCPAVAYLKDRGVTLGCTATTYCPNDFVTRLQMALFLQRMGHADPSNTLGDHTTAIGGGQNNTASSPVGFATVGGGDGNVATGAFSTIGGGIGNGASGQDAVVSGGEQNTASGLASTVPGGSNNSATGVGSFAAGFAAEANFDGCFVWGDFSTDSPVRCNLANRFVVRSVGGIYMLTSGNQESNYAGTFIAPGAQAWTATSDRNSKERLQPIDAEDVLRKVVQLPIATWNWKSQDPAIRHMGPMAQDFSAAFQLGETPKGISTIDADGVALAAIQGLHARLAAQDARLAERDARLAEQTRLLASLTARLVALERRGSTSASR